MEYKRLIVDEFGGPEVLRVAEDASPPEPGPEEARVRIEASSALFTDTLIRKGLYPPLEEDPPFTLGYDFVGTVDAVGGDVRAVEPGDRVADLSQTGGNASFICRPADELVPVPDDADAVTAVPLVLIWMTAYQMLRHTAGVEAGDRILVHGGSGAVGQAMLQLGRHFGLDMVATASASNHDLVRDLGANEAIDYRAPDVDDQLRRAAGDGFDAVFDHVSLASFQRSRRLLRDGGTLVAYGLTQVGQDLEERTTLRFLRMVSLFGAMMALLGWWSLLPDGRSARFYAIEGSKDDHPDRFADDLSHLFELWADGDISLAATASFPLEEAQHVHETIDRGNAEGHLAFSMEPSA